MTKKKIRSTQPDADAARTLAEVEARAAAAHARVLAEAEAAAEVQAAADTEALRVAEDAAPTNESPAAIAARVSGPRRVVTWEDDEDDEDDEDAYDDRWDDASYS